MQRPCQTYLFSWKVFRKSFFPHCFHGYGCCELIRRWSWRYFAIMCKLFWRKRCWNFRWDFSSWTQTCTCGSCNKWLKCFVYRKSAFSCSSWYPTNNTYKLSGGCNQLAIFTRELELGATEKQIQLVVVSIAGPELEPARLLRRRAEKSVTLPVVDIFSLVKFLANTLPRIHDHYSSPAMLNHWTLRYSFRVLILSAFVVVLQQIWWFQSFPWNALTRGLEISSVSRCLGTGHRNTQGNWRSLLVSSCANKLLPARRESNSVLIMVVISMLNMMVKVNVELI